MASAGALGKSAFLGGCVGTSGGLRKAAPLCVSTSAAKGLPKHKGSRGPVAPRAVDNDTLVGIGVGLAGLALGVAVPFFYETQVKGSEKRDNDQPCFPCSGTGAQSCRFCNAKGIVEVELGGGEKETSTCVNCEGRGSITCTTCQGSGVQPRYLDRREFKDDD